MAIAYAEIVGKFSRAVLDASDPDRDPDLMPLVGLVFEFVADLNPAVVKDTALKESIYLDRMPATTNEQGILIGPDGQPGIRLIASNGASIQPDGWTYTVTVRGDGLPALKKTFVPIAGQTIDFSEIIPVPASPGNQIPEWSAVVEQATSAASVASAAATEATAAAGSVQRDQPNGVAPLDGAKKIPEPNLPERLSEAGLSATMGEQIDAAIAALPSDVFATAEAQALLNLIPSPPMATPPVIVSGYLYGTSVINITAGGAGYAVGDEITLGGGGPVPAVLRVTAVNAGAITGVTIVVRGAYTTAPSSPTAQASTTGAGSGATFSVPVSWARAGAGTVRDQVWVQPTDARFRFTGIGPSNQNSSGYYGNGNGNYVSCAWEFATDATKIDIRTIGLNVQFIVEVDGQRVNDVGIVTNSSGQEHIYSMDFGGVRRMRNYRIYGINSAFGGVRIPGDATLIAPTRAERPLIYWLGDSYVNGSGAASQGATAAAVAASALGLDVVANGVGGSGWNSATTLIPATRIANTMPGLTRDATYVAFDLGYNDAGSNMTTLATRFDDARAAVLADTPTAKIIVFGPHTPQGATAALDAVRAVLIERAAHHGLPFIDVRDWVNMANEAVYTGPDNVHPSTLGHKVIGAAKARAVRAVGAVA